MMAIHPIDPNLEVSKNLMKLQQVDIGHAHYLLYVLDVSAVPKERASTAANATSQIYIDFRSKLGRC